MNLVTDEFTHFIFKNLLAMFYIIGLGLSDEKDVSLRGLEVSKLSRHSVP